MTDPLVDSITVERPEDAYAAWEEKRYHGRIVVALGRRLNFVQAEEVSPSSAAVLPIPAHDLARTSEKGLRSNNVLLVAMQTGVARRIVHVVPHDVLEEKIAFARNEAGVSTAAARIDAPYFGSPRTITSLSFLEVPSEPVLLYINASFFRDRLPEDVLAQLSRTGIRADLVVLCRSLDDSEVTAAERERLQRFGELLGGGNGKS